MRGPARGVGGVEVVGSGAVKEWGEAGGIHTATDGRETALSVYGHMVIHVANYI